jgi:hypothetical protein
MTDPEHSIQPSSAEGAFSSQVPAGDQEEGNADAHSDFDRRLEGIVLPGRFAGVPRMVLIAFGLAVLSLSLWVLLLVFLLLGFLTCGGTWPLALNLFLYGFPVHLGALVAGLAAGGGRSDGPAAARLATATGFLGSLPPAIVFLTG